MRHVIIQSAHLVGERAAALLRVVADETDVDERGRVDVRAARVLARLSRDRVDCAALDRRVVREHDVLRASDTTKRAHRGFARGRRGFARRRRQRATPFEWDEQSAPAPGSRGDDDAPRLSGTNRARQFRRGAGAHQFERDEQRPTRIWQRPPTERARRSPPGRRGEQQKTVENNKKQWRTTKTAQGVENNNKTAQRPVAPRSTAPRASYSWVVKRRDPDVPHCHS